MTASGWPKPRLRQVPFSLRNEAGVSQDRISALTSARKGIPSSREAPAPKRRAVATPGTLANSVADCCVGCIRGQATPKWRPRPRRDHAAYYPVGSLARTSRAFTARRSAEEGLLQSHARGLHRAGVTRDGSQPRARSLSQVAHFAPRKSAAVPSRVRAPDAGSAASHGQGIGKLALRAVGSLALRRLDDHALQGGAALPRIHGLDAVARAADAVRARAQSLRHHRRASARTQ